MLTNPLWERLRDRQEAFSDIFAWGRNNFELSAGGESRRAEGLIEMIGLYGVMSYTVARRRNEIGIRMALGADRRQVVKMIMGDAGTLLAIGLGIGTLSALGAARAASALLFGVKPHDPATLITAAVSLAAVAALASYVPAVRASRLEPTEALRED